MSCEPDKILISRSTWLLVRDEIDCIPKGEIHVKGIRDQVLVYAVSTPYPMIRSGNALEGGTAA